MGYINEFRTKLRGLVAAGKTEEAVTYAAETVLQSYRNGLDAVELKLTEAAGKLETHARRLTRKNAPRESGRHYHSHT